jgi:phospholipid/cholesterol/gamma-HCH transport system ATP-binding protein
VTTPAIEVVDVHKSFGSHQVLRGISVRVEPGETLCILGGSGDCCLEGAELAGFRRQIGVTFQSGALLNSMTLAENVALPLEYHTGLDDETIATMVKIKLQQVGLLDAAERRPDQVSGGMKKRAAVARALAMDPTILFYDEPSAGLDPIATARVDRLINDLKSGMGITSVVVTHEMESVQRIADHVLLQYRGEVLLDGSLDELLGSPDPRVQQFVKGDLEGIAADATDLEAYHRDLLM